MSISTLWRRSPQELGLMAVVFVFLLLIVFAILPEAPPDLVTNFCPQAPALNATGKAPRLAGAEDDFGFSPVANSRSYGFRSSQDFYSDEYTNFSLAALQGAIRIPTMSYDDMLQDPKEERRFDVFADLQDYLLKTFPLAAKHVEIVNSYGLLYTFEGSNPELKPVVLMGHQDVVPVPEATLDQWQYPPFEAHFDGETLYGRGTSDTKDTVVGMLEAAESLLSQKWKPERSVVFSFGFDEEIGGLRGARPLFETIHERYGSDGVEIIVDEGLAMPSIFGALAGAVSVNEKGYLNIMLSLNTPGGHSKAPPDHTGIGIMSKAIKRLEAHPYPYEMEDSNPTLAMFRCLAEHAPQMNKELRRTVLDIYHEGHRESLMDFIAANPVYKNMIRTTQAVDVIEGGVKLNALPEKVQMMVNHRVNGSPGTVIDRFEDIILGLAREFDLGLYSQGETLLESKSNGYFNLTVPNKLDPAPISPQSGQQWEWITGTARSVIEAAPFVNEPLVMTPTTMIANTDTRYYWPLTRAIYRFKPALAADAQSIHTVDEHLRFRSHILTVAFFYEFILNTSL